VIQSKALEVNLAGYHVDVEIDPKYEPIQKALSKYYGLTEGVNTFLKELSHPRKNLQFIVSEARGYCLNYFHLIKDHPEGPDAAHLFVEIFSGIIDSEASIEIRADAVDNLLLFLQKMIKDAGVSHIDTFMPVLARAFVRISEMEDDTFFLFAKSYYRMAKLGEELIYYTSKMSLDLKELNRLLIRYFQHTYDYWLSEEDPLEWFESEVDRIENRGRLAEIFKGISHAKLRELNRHLSDVRYLKTAPSGKNGSLFQLSQLLTFPGYNRFVEAYREIPQILLKAGIDQTQGNQWKVIFLFHIMNITGLSQIHEEALRDINRTLGWLINHEKYLNVERLIDKTFSILKDRTREFPATALNCVLNMGRGVYETDESDLIKFFISGVSDLGFQPPRIGGVGNDWQIRVNLAHIQNIRIWLELIELHPKWSTRLLSDLIIYLSVCGVFIKDTDLFPRDITHLLNSDIRPVYNLVKQLARLLPVFFNDIGAEGELRDISTDLDEITQRKDLLIHFLRKQAHVESSNRVVGFIEATLRFWRTADPESVEPFVPPNIFDQIEADSPYVKGVHRLVTHLETERGIQVPEDLLNLDEATLRKFLEEVPEVPERDAERVLLIVRFYRLLHQKYNLALNPDTAGDMGGYLAQLKAEAFPSLDKLQAALKEPDLNRKLPLLLDYLELLKELIFSEQTYEIREDIYKKRHFTVDIPSMYGSYHEVKFDALGLTFRIESLVNVYFDEIVNRLDLTLITKETFYQIQDLLKLFNRALKLDGISSVEIESQLELLAHSLAARGFTFTQYLDIFKGFARAVTNVINDYFNNIHENNLNRILSRIPREWILDKYLASDDGDDPEKMKHRISEVFLREKIALSLGLQQLDQLLSQVLKTLFHQSYRLPDEKLRLLLNYDPQRAMTSITEPEDRAIGIIHLGNKGHNLVKLNRLGFPVPPGFIITTEVFRCREIVEYYPPAEQNFKEQIAWHISCLEKLTDKRFGDPENPLLFSVRSGSSISQPGMMDTFLDVGMNDDIAAGLADKTGNPWFAWDNYRRFIQCYGMSFDLKRDDFDAVMGDFKKKCGVPFKRDFSGDQMRDLALSYKDLVRDSGVDLLEDPFDQLLVTVKKVLNSWESAKAKAYRKIIGISDDWGTAVTVQTMVYGNMSPSAGSGVIFTHNPKWSEDDVRLWGDFTVGNQGEDVVSGLVTTLPISLIQQQNEMRNTDVTLETHFPDIFKTLKEWASELIYAKGWSPQEIEFTFESPNKEDLYVLQSRNMSIRERKKYFAFDPEGVESAVLLGNGVGVSGGAMSGRAVFTLAEIDKWRKLEPNSHLILLRADTVPDDIREINAADGILTARGGGTSHASVVAHRLGKTCVVGCGTMVCDEKAKQSFFGEQRIESGDFLSINGQDGTVYRGFMKVKET